MTRRTLLNDQHIVYVPSDFRINLANHNTAGDYDSLFYNEFEIGTYERQDDYDSVRVYNQPFWVAVDGGDMLINLFSLDAVRAFCDAFPASEKTPEQLAQALQMKYEF